jgi:hypothetical protein
LIKYRGVYSSKNGTFSEVWRVQKSVFEFQVKHPPYTNTKRILPLLYSPIICLWLEWTKGFFNCPQ